MVWHLICNEDIVGSSPTASSMENDFALKVWASVVKNAHEVNKWPAWKKYGTGLFTLKQEIKMLTDDEKEHIQALVDNEGLEYTFVCKTSFKKIKDPEFHRLRVAFLDAHTALNDYIQFDT